MHCAFFASKDKLYIKRGERPSPKGGVGNGGGKNNDNCLPVENLTRSKVFFPL
jgi:hypothetical protein